MITDESDHVEQVAGPLWHFTVLSEWIDDLMADVREMIDEERGNAS